MLDAIGREDIPGAFKAMAPEEVSAISGLYDHAVETARDRGFLTGPSPLTGVDVEFEDLQFATEQLDPGVAQVTFLGGEMTYRIDIDELSSGVKEADASSASTLLYGGLPLDECDECDVMTVLRDGRWYVSPMYTVAQAVTDEVDGIAPDFAAGDSPPRGEDTALGAVGRFVLLEVERNHIAVAELLDPVSLRVLLDYGRGVRHAISVSLAEPQKERASFDVDEMTEEALGSDRVKVYLDHIELRNSWGTKIIIQGPCVTIGEDELGNPTTECLPDEWEIDRLFVIAVRNANGSWYVSPLDTLAEYGDAAIEGMDQEMFDVLLGGAGLTSLLGAQDRAGDKAAQSSLRNALVAAIVCSTDSDTLAGCNADKLGRIEPSLTLVESPRASFGPTEVSTMIDGGGTAWLGASLSTTGVCFYIRNRDSISVDDSMVGTYYGQSADAVRCDAADAAGFSDDSW